MIRLLKPRLATVYNATAWIDRLAQWWLYRHIRPVPIVPVTQRRDWQPDILDISDKAQVPLIEKSVFGKNKILGLGIPMYDIEEMQNFRKIYHGKHIAIRLEPGGQTVKCLCRYIEARWPVLDVHLLIDPDEIADSSPVTS